MFGPGFGLSLARPQLIGGPTGGAPAGGGPFAVNAVHFDGTNDNLLETAITGAAASNKMLASFWMKTGEDAVFQGIFEGPAAGGQRVEIRRESENVLRVIARNNASGLVLLWTGTALVNIAAGWTHVLFAANFGASPTFDIFLNDVEDTTAPAVLSTGSVDWAGVSNNYIGRRDVAGADYFGDLAEFYLNHDEYLDINSADNRRKFIDGDGWPVELGVDGATPTGNAPLVFQSGGTGSWHLNKGSGDGFTEVGALTDAADSPSD